MEKKSRKKRFGHRRRGDKFLPYFAPQYVEIIGEDKDGAMHKLQVKQPIGYLANMIRVVVYLP